MAMNIIWFFVLILEEISAQTFVAMEYPPPDYFYWSEAVQRCEDLGLVLASIHNETESAEATNKTEMFERPAWIGGYRLAYTDEFKWIDGTVWDYDDWFPPNPNQPFGQNTCVVFGLYDYSWPYRQFADQTCSITQSNSIICRERSEIPTATPTAIPTANPTPQPTRKPTASPTSYPTENPSVNPSNKPTSEPTQIPTNMPTFDPTSNPTTVPTNIPTINPSINPTNIPSPDPTNIPTTDPSPTPTTSPICGNNKNSGPRGPIQCENDYFCCEGYKCKLDKGKCIPIDKKRNKKSLIQFVDFTDTYWIDYFVIFMVIANIFIMMYTLYLCCGDKVITYEKISQQIYESEVDESNI